MKTVRLWNLTLYVKKYFKIRIVSINNWHVCVCFYVRLKWNVRCFIEYTKKRFSWPTSSCWIKFIDTRNISKAKSTPICGRQRENYIYHANEEKKKLEIKITTRKSFQIDLKSGYAHSNCNIKNGTDIFTHNQPLYNSNVPTRQISIKCVRQFIRPNSQHTFNLFAISRR